MHNYGLSNRESRAWWVSKHGGLLLVMWLICNKLASWILVSVRRLGRVVGVSGHAIGVL